VSSESVASTTTADRDTARLESLGYRQELSRVLGFFDNFSVAFTYLSPVVGIYSLFALGLGTGGPAYIWLMPIVVIGMLFVSLVFGELGSHYPVAGALYQYSKFTVGPSYGWWVGWFYGVALLVTVASVDTGVVSYVTTLFHNWFGTDWDPTSHSTIFIITLILLAIQTSANIVGAKVMGRIARYGTFVETFGTFGIAIILAIAGFHHGFSYLFKTENVQHAHSNPFGVDFGGHWLLGAALVAILAHVYIFYGFESAGDIAGDEGCRPVGAARDAQRDCVRRHLVVRACPRADSGDSVRCAGVQHRGRRWPELHPGCEPHTVDPGRPVVRRHLCVLLLRIRGAGRWCPTGVLVRA